MSRRRYAVHAVLETGPVPGLQGDRVTERALIAGRQTEDSARQIARRVSKLPFIVAAEMTSYLPQPAGIGLDARVMVEAWERGDFRSVKGGWYTLADGTRLDGPNAGGRLGAVSRGAS